MSNIKVLQLEQWMTDLDHISENCYELPDTIMERNGYYCYRNFVWFEFNRQAFLAFPRTPDGYSKECFYHNLMINDEAILPTREVAAMKTILATSRDSDIKRSLKKRLYRHELALERRETSRRAMKYVNRIMNHMNSTDDEWTDEDDEFFENLKNEMEK